MERLTEKVGWFAARPRLAYAVVFLLALAVYGLIQAEPILRDPDSFYHIKMAQLVAERGPVTDFPWLPFTSLADGYADHHFLYHLLLAPFVAAFGPLAGAKVSAVVLAAAAMGAFVLVLRALRVRHGWLYLAAFVFSTGFMFRASLVKASSLSVAILLLGLLALVKDRPYLLFPLAWIYVWSYGGWPVLLVACGAFLVSAAAVERFGRSFGVASGSDGRSVRRSTLAFGCALSGSVAGLVVNPFFPQNLDFYWHQIVHVALINYGGVIDVGQEWYPAAVGELVRQEGFLLVMLAAVTGVLAVAAMWWREVSAARAVEPFRARTVLALGALSLAFLVLTLRSSRHVEYLVPCAALFAAVYADEVFLRVRLADLRRMAFGNGRKAAAFLVAFALLMPASFIVRNSLIVSAELSDGIPESRYESLFDWMEGRVRPGETVFHLRWDDFPVLLYRSSDYRYVAGLDATFLYLNDPARYVDWSSVGEGRRSDVSAVMRESFGARYLLLDESRSPDAVDRVESDPGLTRVYRDDEVSLYATLPNP